jgi:alpha-N-arabinofuranosidase
MAVGRGSARYATECPEAFNDAQCQRIEAMPGARDVGIAQIVTLPAWRVTGYQMRAFLRSDGSVRAARAVLYHEGRPVSTAALDGIGTTWSSVEARLETPRLDGPLNTFLLAILFDGPGRLDADLVTLFPADTIDGFDPQAVAQLQELHTGWIRWPGGNLASGYRWRDGVGPRERRPSLPNPSWPGLSSNFVGTDEYLRLSGRLGTEPLITVNAGDGTAEEAAAWVEYVNGDTTTPMGRLRARNGHPAPYGVRYWNIGNELWGHWQVGYTNPEEHARRYLAFARAMRAVDPTIRVVANGHGGHSESPPDPWNRPLLENAGSELDIVDVHTYVGVPEEPGLTPEDRAFLLSAIPLSYERWLADFRRDLVRRGLERVQVIVGEYNGSIRSESPAADRLASLLVYAGYLHAFMRQGEYLVGANATEYSPFNPRALPFGRMHPRYDLFRTYARIAGTRPVEAVLETPVVQQDRRVGRDVIPMFNLPLVDGVALKDPGDGSLGFSLINRDMVRPREVEVRLEEFAPAAAGRWILFGDGPDGAMMERPLPAGRTFTVTLPPHSVSLLKVYAAGR